MSANEDHIFKSGAVDTAELRSEQWPLRIVVHSVAAATLSEPTTPGLNFDPAEDPIAFLYFEPRTDGPWPKNDAA